MAQGEEMEIDSKPAEVNGVSDVKDGELQLLFSLQYLLLTLLQ